MMRRGYAGLIAAALALAGCKGAGSKPADRDKDVPSTKATADKGKSPSWLDGVPGAGATVPKAGTWAKPGDPEFDAQGVARGILAGRVTDPSGRGVEGAFIAIEPTDVSPADRAAAQVGIRTKANGYFMIQSLPPGKAYTLTVTVKVEGKPLYGVVQTQVPNPTLAISLRDDMATPPPGAGGGVPPTGTLPPATPDTGLPPPSPDLIPRMDLGTPPAGTPTPKAPAGSTRPADGAWAPGGNAGGLPIPPTITNPGPAAPPSVDPPGARPVVRPESIADGPKPWKPPATSIPGPPTSPFPSSQPPVPPIPPPEKKTSRSVRTGADFALVDTLERPWNLASSRSGSLVLLDFMTTTCVPCKRANPILSDIQARYGASGLQLIGVVCDDSPLKDRIESAAKYHQNHNLNYALYVEPGSTPGKVRDRFKVESYPTAVLLDDAGTVVWKGHPAVDRAALEGAIRKHIGK